MGKIVAITLIYVFKFHFILIHFFLNRIMPNRKQRKAAVDFFVSNEPYRVGLIGGYATLAMLDGVISPKERSLIEDSIKDFVDSARKIVGEQHALHLHTELHRIVDLVKSTKEQNISIYAQMIRQDDPALLHLTLFNWVFMCFLEGINAAKTEKLADVVHVFRIDPIVVDNMVEKISILIALAATKDSNKPNKIPSQASPYAILGVTSGDDLATIKKAYKKKVQKFHPDRIEAAQLDEAFIEFAKIKMQEINGAYDQIKNELNIE